MNEEQIKKLVESEIKKLLGPATLSQWLIDKLKEKRVVITASQFEEAFEKTGKYVHGAGGWTTYCHSLETLMKELGF